MIPTSVRRLTTAGAAAAVLLGGGLASAPTASAAPADGSSTFTQAAVNDQGPRLMKKHKVSDGCFKGSYDTSGVTTTTLYYKNTCKTTHKLTVKWTTGYETYKVRGHSKGSEWGFYSNPMSIYDRGPA
jgi:hypothetical protein